MENHYFKKGVHFMLFTNIVSLLQLGQRNRPLTLSMDPFF